MQIGFILFNFETCYNPILINESIYFITKYIIIVEDLENTGEQKISKMKFHSEITTVKCI